MSVVTSGWIWVRHNFAWSNSADSWRERLLGSAFLAAAFALIYLGANLLALWQSAMLWAVYWLALAVCSRQGWLKLFGPVLFYDLLCTSRRSRYIIMRLLYAGLILFVLFGMYLIAREETLRFRGDRQLTPHDTAVLAETFFSVFLLVQLVVVMLLTPAYVAGSISEEKDRKTLEFLLATDLHNREIVLSKLLSRLANMALLLLTGLPILSMLQFIGGVDPQLMLSSFAGTALTVLGIASVSIWLSTLFKKPRDAIGMTYLLMICYMGLGMVAFSMEMSRMSIMSETIWFGDDAPTVKEAADVLNAGNPLTASIDLGMAIHGRSRTGARTSLSAALPPLLRSYAWFHVPLSLICIAWSVLRLRAIALKQSAGGTTARIGRWDGYRPPVGEMPMLWKEMHIEGRPKSTWIAWVIVIILGFLTLGVGLMVLAFYFWEIRFRAPNPWDSLPERMNHWFRAAGTCVGSLMILMVAVRASTCISQERERDTFDALIASPLSAQNMLAAKLVGILMASRLGWLWFGSMMALAVFAGGLHILAVPLVLGALFIFSLFFIMVGMGYSMVCRSSMRATVFTVLTTLGLGGGHWLITGLCCAPFMHGGSDLEYIVKFQAGLTPPAVLAICSYSWEDLAHRFHHSEMREYLAFCVVGMFLWSFACVILWAGVLLPKFQRITRRENMVYRTNGSRGPHDSLTPRGQG